jgi:small subunit ribosomal protein S20
VAHSLSAKKRVRQSAKRRDRNRARKTLIKKQVKTAVTTLGKGDAGASATEVVKAIKLLDRYANRGTIHKNTAARRKSQLMSKLAKIKAGK